MECFEAVSAGFCRVGYWSYTLVHAHMPRLYSRLRSLRPHVFAQTARAIYRIGPYILHHRVMESTPKRTKTCTPWISGLLHAGATSERAVYNILKKLREAPCDDPLSVVTSRACRDAGDKLARNVEHVEVMTAEDNSKFDWYLYDPNRLLMQTLEHSDALQKAFLEVARRKGNGEWSVIIGFDEYTPGNPWKLETNRKCMNVYYSFAELGPVLLSHDDAWMNPVSVLVTDVKKCKGNWSAMLRRYLRLQFLAAGGLQTSGVPLTLCGETYVLRANIGVLISDGDGHRQSLQWRGAGSLRPCFRHTNVTMLYAGLSEHDAAFCEIDHANPDDFHLTNVAELEGDIKTLIEADQRCEAGALALAQLDKIRNLHGFNCTEDGLLNDSELLRLFDPLQRSIYDWPHTILQDGVFQTELSVLLPCLRRQKGITKTDIETFLKRTDLCFPQATSSQMKQAHLVFSLQRRKKLDVAKTRSMGESLNAFCLMKHFLELLEDIECIAYELDSFLKLASVIDLLLDVKRQHISLATAAASMRCAVRDFMIAHVRAYGRDNFKPKAHWMFDIAEQVELLASLGFAHMPDAFTIERLHKTSKRIAQHGKQHGVKFSKLALKGAFGFKNMCI